MSSISTTASPPSTPMTDPSGELNSLENPNLETIHYDFSKLDYSLSQAKILGQGLWSTVYLAEQRTLEAKYPITPPSTPQRTAVQTPPSPDGNQLLLAVKLPSRPDAKPVFRQEALILTRLQRPNPEQSQHFIVPFHGFDPRNESLIFEAVLGGSLETLIGQLKQRTEVERHLELISIFPRLAADLTAGLNFLHSHDVVHADIKPGNILLDHVYSDPESESSFEAGSADTITQRQRQQQQQQQQQLTTIRARYIDFSASFSPARGDEASFAGGTWDYMAPEQMKIHQKELSTPTGASDVWSLGITLLAVIIGDSPYTAACKGNVFMVREAIKGADPLGFARMDPVAYKRLAASQDSVDCCRLALKKDRCVRTTAEAWIRWLEDRQRRW